MSSSTNSCWQKPTTISRLSNYLLDNLITQWNDCKHQTNKQNPQKTKTKTPKYQVKLQHVSHRFLFVVSDIDQTRSSIFILACISWTKKLQIYYLYISSFQLILCTPSDYKQTLKMIHSNLFWNSVCTCLEKTLRTLFWTCWFVRKNSQQIFR